MSHRPFSAPEIGDLVALWPNRFGIIRAQKATIWRAEFFVTPFRVSDAEDLTFEQDERGRYKLKDESKSIAQMLPARLTFAGPVSLLGKRWYK